jgi:hypothetical protein
MINLQKLNFDSCVMSWCDIVLVASLCNLRKLHIRGSSCHLLRTGDYRDAFQQGNLVNLEVITLKKCDNLDIVGLTALVKNTSKLLSVHHSSLPKRFFGFADMIEECDLAQLQTFCASQCTVFLVSDMDVLKKSCPKIKEIVHKTPDFQESDSDDYDY